MPLATLIDWADRAPGDVGVLHGDDILSKLIIEGQRLAGELKDDQFAASHVFLVSMGHIFEAVYPKVSMSPWAVYGGRPTRVYRLDVDHALQMEALLELQSNWLQAHYDVFGVLGMGFIEIERFINGHNLDLNAFASNHRVWCSELGADYLESLPVGDRLPPQVTDPAQVMNFLDSLL